MSADRKDQGRSFGARAVRFWRRDLRVEVDDEIRFHLEQRVSDLVSRGVPAQLAREQAEREFGDSGAISQQVLRIDVERERTVRRREYFDEVAQDLRFTIRSLRRSPLFTTMAVVCIALGVCVTTTIFGAVNAILLRPLPFREPDRLVTIYSQDKARGYEGVNISWPDYVSWKEQSRSFSDMGIWTWSSLALSGNGEAERIETANVSASVFPLLGVQPMLGRGFTVEEEKPGNDRVILLGYEVWKQRYGGDSTIVGKSVLVDAVPMIVVGVMPPHFKFPERAEAWRPFAVNPAQEAHNNRGYAAAIARLKPGVTLEAAQADLDVVSQRLVAEFPAENRGWNAQLVDLRTDFIGAYRTPLLVFLGAVAFVMIIASANVANLMFARGASRRHETALRLALGAGRVRIVRSVLAESLLLTAVGGVIGLLIARSALPLLGRAFPNGAPFFIALSVDSRVAAFAVGLSALTALLFAWLPAVSSTRLDLQSSLRSASRTASGAHSSTRRGLVVTEVALSVMLIVGATLLVRSYRALLSTDMGFDSTNALTARITMPQARYGTPERRRQFITELYEKLAALPGVERVGAAQGIPFSGWQVQAELTVEGHTPRGPDDKIDAHYQFVSPGYFAALGTPLLRGRVFTLTDRDTVNPVVVINETMANTVFAGTDPIGRRLKLGGANSAEPWATIIGVAKDIRQYRLPEKMGPAVYYSQLYWPTRTQALVIRTSKIDPLSLVPSVRAVMKSMDTDTPLYDVQSLDQAVDSSLWRQRVQGQVLLLFAGMAVLLAAVGIYGIIAWSVTQRTREVGIRMALGSTRSNVTALILGDSMKLTLLGVGIGIAGALALSRVVAGLLYQVSALDLMTFASAPLLLAAVGLMASWVPARRAAKVDPAIAMRAD